VHVLLFMDINLHQHGVGFNAEKGIKRTCLSIARTDNGERTMATKRTSIMRGTSKGGYQPTGRLDDDSTEAMLREIALRNSAQALVKDHSFDSAYGSKTVASA
jgi:hypothetical protein